MFFHVFHFTSSSSKDAKFDLVEAKPLISFSGSGPPLLLDRRKCCCMQVSFFLVQVQGWHRKGNAVTKISDFFFFPFFIMQHGVICRDVACYFLFMLMVVTICRVSGKMKDSVQDLVSCQISHDFGCTASSLIFHLYLYLWACKASLVLQELFVFASVCIFVGKSVFQQYYFCNKSDLLKINLIAA